MKVLFYIKYITILNDKEEKIWGFLHHQSVQHTGKLKNKKRQLQCLNWYIWGSLGFLEQSADDSGVMGTHG